MGNQPSSEAYGESLFVQPPPPDRPLPPLPPLSTHASRISHASHVSHVSHVSQSSFASASSSTQKLSKPRIRSTAGLLKSPDAEKGTGSRRFSTSGIAQLVASSFSSPNTPSSPSFAALSTSRPLPPPPPPLLPPSPGARSPSVFTFEEAVVAVTGQRDPAAWRPVVSSIYPTPSLDLELLQEQQARQLEFELRQRQNQIRYQQLQLEAQRQQVERQLRRYSSFDPAFYDHAATDIELIDDEPLVRQTRGRRLQNQKQKTKDRSKRRPLFRSRSSQRPDPDLDNHDDRDYRDFHEYQRRNSTGSVYHTTGDRHTWDIGSMTYDQALGQQYGGSLTKNWPPPAGSRASWNYDLSSYAAKRLLHIVDNNPLDNRLERASVASESRYSLLSEMTWKSSHPVRPESPTLARANSDLSLYAPVRRTSMAQTPGVATRRNSTSSFVSAGGTSARPAFRNSHPTATTPSLSRRASFESNNSRVLSMPPPLPRPEPSTGSSGEEAVRVSTPSDEEYNAIGAFKLGSLRITNGAESPMSSPETKRSKKPKPAGKEAVGSPEHNAAEITRTLAALSAVDTGTTGSNVPSTTATSTTKPSIDNRDISPLSPALFQPPVELLAALPEQTVFHELPAREPVVSPTDLPQLELSQDLFADFEFTSFSFEDTVAVEPPSMQPTRTVSTLQTTSKSTAVEDMLFEDDHSTSGYADTEVLDVRLDPSAKTVLKSSKPGPLAARKSAHSIFSISRSDSDFVSSPTSESSHKPLSKADSGYSSNVSLRSFKQAATKLIGSGSKAANRLSSETDPTTAQAPERQSFVIDELQLPSPTINAPNMGFQPLLSPATISQIKRKPLPPSAARPPPPKRQPPFPPPPMAQSLSSENVFKDELLLSPISISMTDTSTPATSESSSAPGLPDGAAAPVKKRHAVPRPLDSIQAPLQSDIETSPRTSPIPLTPVSIRSNESASAPMISNGVQHPGKLFRFLSFANSASSGSSSGKATPTVHVTHIADGDQADSSSAPNSVNKNARERISLFPTAAKKLALKTQMSRDALKAIFNVGSAETRTGSDANSSNTSASAAEDDISRNSSRASRHRHTFQASSSLASVAAAAVMPLKAVAKRKSRLSMTMDLADEFEAEGVQNPQGFAHFEGTTTPEPSEENKSGKSRRSWLRWGKEENRQTQVPGHGVDADPEMAAFNTEDLAMDVNSYDDSALVRSRSQRPPSRSSSIISRTMSLTAQLERSLSLRFPKLSRASNSDRPAVPISAFSTARNVQPLSPSLPSPLLMEALEHQRRAMTPDSVAAASLSVNTRAPQIRPSMLRVPPPLRPRSRSSSESGSRRSVSHQNSQDSLYNAASAQFCQVTSLASSMDYNDVSHITGVLVASPPQLESPLSSDPSRWDVQPGPVNNGGAAARHRRESSSPSYQPRRSLSGDDAQRVTMGPGGRMYIHGNGSQDSRARVIRHRASFNGYSNDMSHTWDDGNHAALFQQPHPQQSNPPRMSNGYTGQVMLPYGSGHRRSGSSSSSHSDIYQLQQQQAWDFYYQQYARPPPNVPRGAHHRNRSLGSRHGPVPGPQAPYRILHSYNSPAYRGVPIWG